MVYLTGSRSELTFVRRLPDWVSIRYPWLYVVAVHLHDPGHPGTVTARSLTIGGIRDSSLNTVQ